MQRPVNLKLLNDVKKSSLDFDAVLRSLGRQRWANFTSNDGGEVVSPSLRIKRTTRSYAQYRRRIVAKRSNIMSFQLLRRRSLVGGVLAVVMLFGCQADAGIEEGANALLKSLADQAIKSLTDADTPRPERIRRFRNMFRENFAVRSIGKFVLGRNWRRASHEEREEYLVLFEDLIVVTYVDRFRRLAGGSMIVKKTRAESDRIVTVFSEIERPGDAKPVHVNWRVGTNGASYKLLDVIVEGASLSNTLRSDFGSIVRQKGNQIGGLLTALREKTEALKAEHN